MTRSRCTHYRRCPPWRVLAATGAAVAVGLAGCLEDNDAAEPADPIDLLNGETCDTCGMVIEDHYGPAGQLFKILPETSARRPTTI